MRILAVIALILGLIAATLLWSGSHEPASGTLEKAPVSTTEADQPRQAQLSLAGNELADQGEQRAPVLNAPIQDPVTPAEASAKVAGNNEDTVMASIVGSVSFLLADLPEEISIEAVGCDAGRGNIGEWDSVQLSAVDGVPDGAYMTFAWALDDLLPGNFNITYGQSVVQVVDLLPGPNEVQATIGGSREIEVQFVNELTGEWVGLVRLDWASSLGEPSNEFQFDSTEKRSHISGSGSIGIKGVETEWVSMRVRAMGYCTWFGSLYLPQGDVQVVKLVPTFQLVLTMLDEFGKVDSDYLKAGLLLSSIITAGGETYSPDSYGLSSGKHQLNFPVPSFSEWAWELKPPDGFELIDPYSFLSSPIGPGLTLEVTIQAVPQQ